MIIYGWREARLKTGNLDDGFCTNCGQKGTICYASFSKHAHVFWIPLFPFSKRKLIQCSNCNKEYHISELNPEQQQIVQESHRKSKPPLWQWLGLLLIAASLISGFINTRIENSNAKSYFESPEINDVYCYKEDGAYSLMYIDEITEDSIYFIDNIYEVKSMSNAKDLHKQLYYDYDVVYGFSKEELHNLFYEEKSIIKIWRNLSYSTKPLKTIGNSRSNSNDSEDEEIEEDEEDET